MKCPYDVGAIVHAGDRGETYRLVRRLGDGASAFVYEADDFARGRRVALKLLRQGASPARMQREWRALQTLRHPGIRAPTLLRFHPRRSPHPVSGHAASRRRALTRRT